MLASFADVRVDWLCNSFKGIRLLMAKSSMQSTCCEGFNLDLQASSRTMTGDLKQHDPRWPLTTLSGQNNYDCAA